MQVVCHDGTIFQCAAFRAIDSGVLLFEETPGESAETDEEEAEEAEADLEEQEAIGFVPLQQIRYVVSDALLQPGAGPQTARAPTSGTGGQTRTTQPTQASPQHQGGAPTGGQPGTGGQTGTSQRPPGR